MPQTTTIILFLVIASSRAAHADGSITVPWNEFEALYQAQLATQLGARSEQPTSIHAIDSVDYRLQVDDSGVHGQIVLLGKVLRSTDQPARPVPPIPLFGTDLTITAVNTISGGSLLSDANGYRLFVNDHTDSADSDHSAFQLSIDVALPVQEDQRSRFVTLTIPAAVQNRLELSAVDGLRLLDTPGLTGADGRRYFGAQRSLTLRFAAALDDPKPAVDTFTQIKLHGTRYHLTVYLLTATEEPSTTPLQLTLPAGVRYLGGSLPPSRVFAGDGDSVVIAPPSPWRQPIALRFELPHSSDNDNDNDNVSDTETNTKTTVLRLPTISDNRGREGEFILHQPIGGRIQLSGEGLQSGLSATALRFALREVAQPGPAYARLPRSSALTLQHQRFEAIDAPQLVLDRVQFTTRYSDNGSALSSLRLQLPADLGPALRLVPPSGAELWSLTVNGEPRQLYQRSAGAWLVPLGDTNTNAADVVLRYLTRSEPLSLNGKLIIQVPQLELSARSLQVSVALPERVELVAMEGDLEPSSPPRSHAAKADQDLANNTGTLPGRHYHFRYPFYRGTGLRAALFYQEPLDGIDALHTTGAGS